VSGQTRRDDNFFGARKTRKMHFFSRFDPQNSFYPLFLLASKPKKKSYINLPNIPNLTHAFFRPNVQTARVDRQRR
jgi:hypothetical protein